MRIDALEESKHIKGRYLVHLSDQSLLKVTDVEVVTFHLYPGRELDEGTLADLREAADRSNARALATKLIGHRPQSRKELLQRMKEKGIAQRDAEAAADWLEELGVLDDGAYACTVVRHYSQRGYGQKKLEAELYRRGVGKEHWAAALSEAEPPENGISAFLQARLRGKNPNDPREIKRVSDALLRRGYSWNQIKEGLRAYGSQVEEDSSC